MKMRHSLWALALALAPSVSAAQWATTYDQFYYPGRDNWVFRTEYPAADRLFNAFDYGHAILYELLYTRPTAPPAMLEDDQYGFLTQKLLVSPPRLPLKEMAIMPHYARLAPEAKQMFEWAHILHRQVYDVLADERLDTAAKDQRLQELTRYYRSRPDLAFSSHPKTMALMQEQYYSLAFRERYPKFNGLIWGYHWLQVGLYEPLIVGRTREEKQAGVSAAVARFRQMLTDPPCTFPYQMPMTSAIAPQFAARYPELAIIFDNLHSMHDVISDILASERVPRDRKRAEILRAASRFRDDTSEVMAVDGWRRMSQMMGVNNMGGPSVGFLPALPTPTVSRGYVMRHDRDGNMIGDDHTGHATPRDTTKADAHAGHVMPKDTAKADAHAGHVLPKDTTKADAHVGHVMPKDSTKGDAHAGHMMKGAEHEAHMAAMAADTAAIVAVVQDFFGAIAAGDSARAIALLDPDVVIQEGGRLETRDAYAGRHLGLAIAYARAVKITHGNWRVRRSGETAWVTSTVHASGTFNGRAMDSTGEELVVLSRKGGAWRIMVLHGSSESAARR